MLTVKRSRILILVSAASSVSAIALFVSLAYQHTILVPYVSPTILTVEGLESEYIEGGMLNYEVKADGYGSNCLSLTVNTFLISRGEQDKEVYYYKKADDCKQMKITFGQYNYMRSFTYGGAPITGAPGKYKVVIDFVDLVNNQKASETRFFSVGD